MTPEQRRAVEMLVQFELTGSIYGCDFLDLHAAGVEEAVADECVELGWAAKQRLRGVTFWRLTEEGRDELDRLDGR
jgi:hypothetical protein